MSEPRAAPLHELHSARDAARVSELWALAHPLGPCAGDPAPPPRDAWGIEVSGELAALGAVRTWGRVGLVHGLAVAEPLRRRGLGLLLLNELVAELERRDVATLGLEVDAAGAGALTLLARAGFKPMQLSFVLEAAADASQAGAAPPLRALSAEELDAGVARRIAATVDAELDPSAWCADRVRREEAEVLVAACSRADGDGEQAALLVVPRQASSDVLFVSMLLCPEGPARETLPPVIASLRRLALERSLARVQVAAPSRYWDATRALFDMGFRPHASFLRLLRSGYPERADAGRACLTTWR